MTRRFLVAPARSATVVAGCARYSVNDKLKRGEPVDGLWEAAPWLVFGSSHFPWLASDLAGRFPELGGTSGAPPRIHQVTAF